MDTENDFQTVQPRGRRGRILRAAQAREAAEAASPLMSLPQHVRERILQMCLTEPNEIEICPEPFRFIPGLNTNLDALRPDGILFANAKDHHVERLHNGIGQHIGLLRASKQLHEEGSRVLYGQNEFRFTNTAAWLGLEYFLHHIQPRNAGLLREITVLHPWFLLRPASINNAETLFKGMLYWQQIQRGDRGHRGIGHGRKWFEHWSPARVVSKLESIEGLRHIRILIPRDVDHSGLELQLPLDPAKFGNLYVTIGQKFSTGDVEAEARDEALDGADEADDGPRAPGLSARAIANAHNAKHGTSWKAEALVIDDRGDYTARFLHRRIGRDLYG